MAISDKLSKYMGEVGVTQDELDTLFGGEKVMVQQDGKVQLTEEQAHGLSGEQLVWLRNLDQEKFDQAIPNAMGNEQQKQAKAEGAVWVTAPENEEIWKKMIRAQWAEKITEYLNEVIPSQDVETQSELALKLNERDIFTKWSTDWQDNIPSLQSIKITSEDAKNFSVDDIDWLKNLNPDRFNEIFKATDASTYKGWGGYFYAY